MTSPSRTSIISWLIAQRQMLSIWLDEIENSANEQNRPMIEKLQSHERWLRRSIRELQANG